MSISKTRNRLVECARELFARQGFEATTMNDIARESGKGRRTLYTYFKSKDDIYFAVIETELERLSDRLDELSTKRIRPMDKIIELNDAIKNQNVNGRAINTTDVMLDKTTLEIIPVTQD